MARAWVFQDYTQKKRLGEAKCPWSVGWIDPDGKRRSKRIGCRSLAEKFARKIETQLDVWSLPKKQQYAVSKFQGQSKMPIARLAIDVGGVWPSVPLQPRLSPTLDGAGLPEASGIYFVWESGMTLAYVGQATVLSNRVCLRKHKHLRSTDEITYIIIPLIDLYYAEQFYIGLLKPSRNGGQRLPHRRSANTLRKSTQSTPASSESNGRDGSST